MNLESTKDTKGEKIDHFVIYDYYNKYQHGKDRPLPNIMNALTFKN